MPNTERWIPTAISSTCRCTAMTPSKQLTTAPRKNLKRWVLDIAATGSRAVTLRETKAWDSWISILDIRDQFDQLRHAELIMTVNLSISKSFSSDEPCSW